MNPYLGRWPIGDVTAPELLKLLRRIETRGTIETAHRVRSVVSRVFRFAIATGRAERDPAADLKGGHCPGEGPELRRHRRAAGSRGVHHHRLPLVAVYGPQQRPRKLAPLVFVRPGEFRGAEWREFDLDAAEWRIPAGRTKMDERHIVPLSRQSLAVLQELQMHTGGGRLLFPSLRSRERPISENTLNAALRRMGYGTDDMTSHGFRTVASTLLNASGSRP